MTKAPVTQKSKLIASSLIIFVSMVLDQVAKLAAAENLRGRPLVVTLTLAAAALATVAYLAALATGPASVVVPLVATSPTLGGLLGIVLLKERTSKMQRAGIATGLLAMVLLASQV